MDKSLLEKIISELTEIEKDTTCHGNIENGEIDWNDGCKHKDYEEYIKDYVWQTYQIELVSEDVLTIWKAVENRTENIVNLYINAQEAINNLEGEEVSYLGTICKVKNGNLYDLEQEAPNNIDIYLMSETELKNLIEELS